MPTMNSYIYGSSMVPLCSSFLYAPPFSMLLLLYAPDAQGGAAATGVSQINALT
jgi:hypothetical protein